MSQKYIIVKNQRRKLKNRKETHPSKICKHYYISWNQLMRIVLYIVHGKVKKKNENND